MNIYGKNVVKEAILEGNKIEKIYLTQQFKEYEILSLIEKKGYHVQRISKDQMDRMESGNHQGILAVVQNILMHL